ncbi:hypothetical protein PC9H_000234 [Pleurotus ostreatus]|uniref:Mucoidy inhibitor A n=1 Tax=Pleurotus ostreatus TaxID=5322 RepID=A0A8H7DWF4_PLEOS|nr:uncharacterized protein PC9H_000234 [Pleurotus ostreatus]KAF7439897.1 hypothetical protein PC9H_000234 [Pleurotus ostreatus]KAJ8700909.1 hypothetical protein PTI98_003887 [Pleurotus ostreatus]
MLQPPASPSFTHQIDLSSECSKIDKVSLYCGRAEITRSYKIDVKTGRNQIKISKLPSLLDDDSLRVEGRGPATIIGVAVARPPASTTATASPILSSLEDLREVTQKAIARCTKAISSIESYLVTLDTKTVGSQQIGPMMDTYETEAEKLDLRLLKLEAELNELNKRIEQERALRAAAQRRDSLLGKTATIDLFVDAEGQVELVLIYAVVQATWSAVYDLRANISSDTNTVNLVYKAAITQSTGESWDDVSLTLETVTPTFGVGLPRLDPWRVGVYKPVPRFATRKVGMASRGPLMASSGYELYSEDLALDKELSPEIVHRETIVTNQGHLSTSFQVPGFISVPTDGEVHTVTVVELRLDAAMAWISIPKVQPKIQIKAKIKNASNFPLLQGIASVYVDGTFVSKTTVPEVSPQESFDCSLGFDPSIRMTYHPLSKKASESGFYNKSSSITYSQHITVYNTKNIIIKDLTIIDQVPISEDAQVTIKLVNPALPPPPAASSSAISSIKSVSKSEKLPPPIKVADNVMAQWDGVDDPEGDKSAIGREGRLAWKCTLPPQSKINLTLVWEVSAAANVTISGL